MPGDRAPFRRRLTQIRPLHVDRNILRDDRNLPARLKLATAFRLLQRARNGEDVQPFLESIRAMHGDGFRVICQLAWTDGPGPIVNVPAAEIAQFAKWIIGQGYNLELTVLADCTALGQTKQYCIDRVADVLGHVAGLPLVVEVANEPEQDSKNLPPGVTVWDIIDALALRDKANRPVLMSSGAYVITGNESTFDALDILNDHGPRKWDWPGEAGKLGHFTYDGWAGNPGWKGFHGRDVHTSQDEPIGAGKRSPQDGARDDNPRNFGDGGAGYAMGNGSATFHATSLLQAMPPTEIERTCGEAWYQGVDFFPPDAPLGRYTHNTFPDFPLVSFEGDRPDLATEVAGRIMPDDKTAYVVAAQATDAWRAQRQTQGGWRIVREGGPVGNWMELAR